LQAVSGVASPFLVLFFEVFFFSVLVFFSLLMLHFELLVSAMPLRRVLGGELAFLFLSLSARSWCLPVAGVRRRGVATFSRTPFGDTFPGGYFSDFGRSLAACCRPKCVYHRRLIRNVREELVEHSSFRTFPLRPPARLPATLCQLPIPQDVSPPMPEARIGGVSFLFPSLS